MNIEQVSEVEFDTLFTILFNSNYENFAKKELGRKLIILKKEQEIVKTLCSIDFNLLFLTRDDDLTYNEGKKIADVVKKLQQLLKELEHKEKKETRK